MELKRIPLEQIQFDPRNPRTDGTEGLEELTVSMRGGNLIVQPPILIPTPQGYLVLVGERRPEVLPGRRMLLGGSGDLIDGRPIVVVLAERVPLPHPSRCTESGDDIGLEPEALLHLWVQAATLREHGDQAVGVLGLDSGLKVGAKEHGETLVYDAFQQPRIPAESSRCHRHACDRVPCIVVAVPKGPLAVFPRFAPVDGGETDEECITGKLRGDGTPHLCG